MVPPCFTRLKAFVKKGFTSSSVDRSENWGKETGQQFDSVHGRNKQKASTSTGAQKGLKNGTTGGSTWTPTSFAQRKTEWYSQNGVFEYERQDEPCP